MEYLQGLVKVSAKVGMRAQTLACHGSATLEEAGTSKCVLEAHEHEASAASVGMW